MGNCPFASPPPWLRHWILSMHFSDSYSYEAATFRNSRSSLDVHVCAVKISVLYFEKKWKISCRQCKLQVKFFFVILFTSFDRVEVGDHEYLLFSLTKFFLSVESYEILRGCQFCQKTHLFQKYVIFLLSSFFPTSENNFFQIQHHKLGLGKFLISLQT